MWVEPYPTRLPSYRDLRRARDAESTIQVGSPGWLKVVTPRVLPFEPLPGFGIINRIFWKDIIKTIQDFCRTQPTVLGIGKPSELAIQLLSMRGFKTTFYDAMDDFPAFYLGLSRWSMAKREMQVVGKVSKVLGSSTSLYMRWNSQQALLARNACAIESLPSAGECLGNRNEHMLGYVGTMGEWFDWDLVLAIARAKPRMRVHLIGPVFSSVPADMPDNVELLPPCSHEKAISAMCRFSVGLIPFKNTRLTDSVDPIKYYEYRALGLPVISSAFGEMRYHGDDSGVFLVDENSNIASVIDRALAYEASFDEINHFRVNNSWETRFEAAGFFK